MATDQERLKEALGMLKELSEDSKYSDLKIICHDKFYNLHKAIVCPRSTFFAKACDSEFKEDYSGEIELKGDDDDALRLDDANLVELMVTYLYTLDYLSDSSQST